uniref:Uncharacterized protein n=1 Tax=Trypanosoma vivax (strain Y486) TaxID=1055687 RepID=G0UC27_TRYVY|nr:hypothetical protein TVY486_1108590 [Trypanosoma vivax Y486]
MTSGSLMLAPIYTHCCHRWPIVGDSRYPSSSFPLFYVPISLYLFCRRFCTPLCWTASFRSYNIFSTPHAFLPPITTIYPLMALFAHVRTCYTPVGSPGPVYMVRTTLTSGKEINS